MWNHVKPLNASWLIRRWPLKQQLLALRCYKEWLDRLHQFQPTRLSSACSGAATVSSRGCFFRIKVSQLTSIHCVWTREGYAYATFTWVLKCSRKKCSYKRWSSCKGMTRLGLSETVVSRMPNNLSQSRLTNELSICRIKTAIFLRVFFSCAFLTMSFFPKPWPQVCQSRESQTVPDSPGASWKIWKLESWWRIRLERSGEFLPFMNNSFMLICFLF